MGVWVRGVLVLALELTLAGCESRVSSGNEDQAIISIYNTGNGWGFQHSWVIREDDSVGEFSYSPNLDFGFWGFLDNGKRKTSGIAPGAYQAVKMLMEEFDFNHMNNLCREPRSNESLTMNSDSGEMVMSLRENCIVVRALGGCGNGRKIPMGQYNEPWRMLEQAIKGFVEQGAGTISP